MAAEEALSVKSKDVAFNVFIDAEPPVGRQEGSPATWPCGGAKPSVTEQVAVSVSEKPPVGATFKVIFVF
jgi:hypothetical protein